MRFVPLTAASLVTASLLLAPAAEAANRPRWTHVVLTHGRDLATRLNVTYVTDTAGEASSATARFLAPFDGPSPYASTVALTPAATFIAVARTRIGFSADATGFTYPLSVVVRDGLGGATTLRLDATVRAAGGEDEADAAAADSASGAEIVALADEDGDGTPDSYRLTLTVSGDTGVALKDVSVAFLDDHEGPAPHARSLTMPFKAFKQDFASAALYFDGDPSRYVYALALTPNDADGAASGETTSFSVKVKAELGPASVGTVAVRTAPVAEICAGGPEEGAGEAIRCSDDELALLVERLADLHEIAALAEAAAAEAEARAAYLAGKDPMAWTTAAADMEALLTAAAAAEARAQIAGDVVADALAGLSAEELVRVGQLVDALHPEAQETMTAYEAGQALGGGFFLSGVTPVPVAEGEVVFDHQIVVDGFAFDPREVLDALRSGASVRTQKTHPTGLRLGISKGWEKCQVVWDSLATTPEAELALHPAFEGASVAVVVGLPQNDAIAVRAAAAAAYGRLLDGAAASLAARNGGGTWTSDPVVLRHRYDAQAGQALSLPGVLNVLNGDAGALTVSLVDGATAFIAGDGVAYDADAVSAHVNGGGLTGAWTFDDLAAQDASVAWRLGAPAASVDDAAAATQLAARSAAKEAGIVAALRQQIAGASDAIQALQDGPTRIRRRDKGGFVVDIDGITAP
ncbi:MAG: hypothetical protein H6745_29950 [Deltaproteobacteria bacterium]|nr:hypothetical protein [Deltaproteobacteria bacterium]